MAEQFITYTAHGVVETNTLVCTHGGSHIYNVVADVDIDNGSVCVLGDFVEEDYFKAEIPAVTDAVMLIATEPKIYSEYTKMMQHESNFYNGAGEIMQADDLYLFDRFSLSDEAFAETAAPAIGQYVGVTGDGYKLTTLGTDEPAGRGFVGYIYHQAANGRWRIIVKRNLKVEA